MSKDEIKAIIRRVIELEERNKAFQKQAEVLQNDLTEVRQVLEKLSSTRSDTDSTETETTESTQGRAAVVGHGAVRDPDGNLRTFTAQSLMAETGI